LPISFYQEHHIGSLSSRAVNDAYIIADGINSSITNYFQTPFALISTVSLCFVISWQLTLLVFVGFPLLIVPIVFIAGRIRAIARQIQKRQESFAQILVEFLSGIQTIKLFAKEDFLLKKYTAQNKQMADLEKKSARYDISSRPILHTAGILCLVGALLFGLKGLNLQLHEVLLYAGLLSVVYEPIKKFAEENGRIQRGIAATERLNEVLSLRPTIFDRDGAAHFDDLKESIEFRNVTFGYTSDPVLQNLSFRVNKGEKVAICGPTGAGKSTLVSLIPRLYEVQAGEILIDSKPLSHYSQKSLREKIAVVPQRPFLFFATVKENISFGEDAPFEKIKQSAMQAHADEFIIELENGYDTVLAEAGKSLSGGQQQRLTIARALFQKAPVLILDEATSSLDATSEEQIKVALRELKGQVTQIIIAHRFSTIEDADRIIYLEKGQKVAEGTKDELLVSCPPFKKMWEYMYEKRKTLTD
ncbi:MAG TPA: ABC transporter ATP-binding protein, partial [Chlamydiales bacterium]|nr:ABC transporter ATP-binding protein [Chlamydiales bacterium]